MGISASISPLRRTPSQRRARSLLTRRATAALTVAAVGLLTGCAANFNAQTSEPYQPAEGVSNRDGEVYAINTLVVTDGEGNGTVVSRLINQQDVEDELESIAATDSSGKDITTEPLAEPIDLATAPSADQSVQVGTDGLLRLTGDNLEAGDFVTLTFTFGVAGPITVDVPVVDVGTIYTDIPVGPVATTAETTG